MLPSLVLLTSFWQSVSPQKSNFGQFRCILLKVGVISELSRPAAMPSTFTRYPVDTERKDPGIGGKPPVDRRPTGGGGNGDDDEWNRLGRSGPRELLRRFRFGIFAILAGDMMFFLGLAVLFFAHQGTGHFDARTQE